MELTTAEKIAALAKELIGTEFEYGGQGPDKFDNSGFVYYCCVENGVKLPRRTSKIAEYGKEVTRAELLPGDIVVFADEVGGTVSLVGIYVGDRQFVSCNNASKPTRLLSIDNSYWKERFICGRRVA